MPPVSLKSRRFTDFDEFADAMSGWDLEWIQIDGGPLEASLAQITTPAALHTRAYVNRRFLQKGASPPGLRTFAFLDDPVLGTVWCGRSMDSRKVSAFDPCGDYESVSPPAFSAHTLSFREEHLATVASTLGGRELDELLPMTNHVLVCPVELVDDLRRRLRGLPQLVTQGGPPGAVRAAARVLDFELPAALLTCLAASIGDQSVPRARLRDRAYRRAMRFIHETRNHAVSIEDICAASGASLRTLEYAFRERLGVTPKAYTKALRLNAVRQDLTMAPPATPVNDVAGRHGFWHMGDFAADYRKMFGELPSETLRR